MTREEFFEKLDEFDFSSFEIDEYGMVEISDVYSIVQFFANKIYDDFEKELDKRIYE